MERPSGPAIDGRCPIVNREVVFRSRFPLALRMESGGTKKSAAAKK
jgi:hypothetical protein